MAQSILDDLPRGTRALLPEMDRLGWREETRANCAACVMLPDNSGEDPAMPWSFDPDIRCCTYHPSLPNHLAGRALARGGAGADVIRARLSDPSGVSAWGIAPSASWQARHDRIGNSRFGRDLALRCPFWVGGEYTCGVWRDRTAVCRTWYCRHDRGLRKAHELTWFRIALTEVERLLADFCAERGTPPGEGAAPEQWCRFYRWCADRVERATGEELVSLESAQLRGARARLAELLAQPEPTLPERVVPAVTRTWERDGRVRIAGYSDFDPVIAPRSVFLLLSRLDGETGWREALAQVNAELAEPIEESLVYELFRAGALEAPPASPRSRVRLRVLPMGEKP